MQGLTAQERCVELLRTPHDARQSWDGRGGDDPIHLILMPRDWVEYYQELEHRLVELRENQHPLWWHVSYRYRFGESRVLVLPITRGRKGARFLLPPRTELVAGGPAVGTKHAIARVYQWPEAVDPDTVTEGVETLTAMMYNGRPDLINLPPDLYRRVLADKLVAA